jgi:hypothetical protein
MAGISAASHFHGVKDTDDIMIKAIGKRTSETKH